MQTIPTSRKNMTLYGIQQHSYLTPLTNYNKIHHPWDSLAQSNNHRQLWNLNCAYHPKEKITNFCKDSDCLLPLCPKCIKIHMDQHSKKGIFANFDTIKDCFEQAQRQYGDTITYINSLGKLGNQVQNFQRDRVFMAKESFHVAKKKAFIELENIFNHYESIIDEEILKDQKRFNLQLIEYQDSLSFVLEGCKNGIKKIKNPANSLQGLINFYGQNQLRSRLKIYQSKLKEISMNLISISTIDSELINFSISMKKFLNFGQKNQQVQLLFDDIHEANVYNKPTYADLRRDEMNFNSMPHQSYNFKNNSQRQNTQYDRGAFTSKNNNGNSYNNVFGYINSGRSQMNISNRMRSFNDSILKYETPLDNYSLQKSRQMKYHINRSQQQK